MRRRKSNRHLKKYLRLREKQLAKRLKMFLGRFNAEQPLDDKNNFRLLLNLRWLISDFIYVRLKLRPELQKKQWFLDLFDVDQVRVGKGNVELVGDMAWWAEGKDAVGEWWPADHEAHWVGPYKVKVRGDLSGGYWVLEPLAARLRMPKLERRDGEYEIEFGKGSTYMKIMSKKWLKAV